MPAYKDTAHKTWYVQFRVKDAQGQWISRRKRGFKSKHDAEAYESAFLASYTPFSLLTFGEAVDFYMKHEKVSLRPNTFSSKQTYFERNILPFWSKIRLIDIVPRTVLTWEEQLAKDGVAPTSLKRSWIVLSSAFNFFVHSNFLKNNPAVIAGCPYSSPTKAFNFWTLDDFHKFLAWAPKSSPAVLAIKILYYTGIRIGELLALTSSDIDFSAGTISISKTLVGTSAHPKINQPKTKAGYRTILLPPFLLNEIKNYVSSLFVDSNTLLFPFSRVKLRLILDKAVKELKLPKIRIHDLRHSNASLLVYLGYSPLMIKKRLGHSNIAVTLDTYARLYRQEDEEVVSALDTIEQNMNNELVCCTAYFYPAEDSVFVTFADFLHLDSHVYSNWNTAMADVRKLIMNAINRTSSIDDVLSHNVSSFNSSIPSGCIPVYFFFSPKGDNDYACIQG